MGFARTVTVRRGSAGGATGKAPGGKGSLARAGAVLCRLEHIPDPGGKGFTVRLDGETCDIFAVRKGGEVFAYVNVCCHRGLPLNWKPDTFLTHDKTRILCANHAATFDMRDGSCLSGPCAGQSLEVVAVTVKDGAVTLLG